MPRKPGEDSDCLGRGGAGLRGWLCVRMGAAEVSSSQSAHSPAQGGGPSTGPSRNVCLPQLQPPQHPAGCLPSPPAAEGGSSLGCGTCVLGAGSCAPFHPVLLLPVHPSPIICLLTGGPESGVAVSKAFGIYFRNNKTKHFNNG